jgi:DNA-binding MarR family transcriptional regulator
MASASAPERILQRLDWQVVRRLDGMLQGDYRSLFHGSGLDFAALRDLLEVSDSVLSKAISHLDALGYVRVTKGYAGNRPRTWVATRRAGAAAFDRHVQALQAIAAGMDRDATGAARANPTE